MNLSDLFRHALLFGALLTVGLAALMLASFVLAPDMWVGDYPSDIRRAYGEMSRRGRRLRPMIGVLFFGWVLIVVGLAALRLRDLAPADPGFWAYALVTFVTLMTFNTFDLLIADWLLFVAIQPRRIVLPGTEGLAGYKDYAFHFRGFLVGTLLSAAAGLVTGVVAVVLQRFVG